MRLYMNSVVPSLYVFSNDVTQALTHNLADYWQSWVDFPQEALDTIAQGGYYNVRITDNLRVISFNSDYGSVYIVRLVIFEGTKQACKINIEILVE